MALTPAVSSQYANLVAVPPVLNDGRDHGKLRMAYAKLTLTAAGTGTAQVIRLPAGRVRIFPILGRVVCPAGTSGGTLAVGLGAYVKADGTTQSAVTNAIAAATSTTSAVDAALAAASTVVELESKGGVDVTVTQATQNTAASGDVIVMIPYVLAG